ncbi:MAG: FtsX-like permease family protein, partial [Candidatus Korarchaeota archaeon]|nr:FtsX-like permease family protein [Candidatus Korarchaeota archaeon]
MGATKRQLVQQFLGEALILTGLALLLAVFLVELSIPHFNALIGKELTIHFHQNWELWFGLIGIGLFVGLLSGSYPALFLSAFQPIYTLKGRLKTGSSGVTF